MGTVRIWAIVVVLCGCGLAVAEPVESPSVVSDVNEENQTHIGSISIIGNTVTSDGVILRHLNLYTGQVFRTIDLREAERNLERLGIFKVSHDGKVRPTVEVIEKPVYPESKFKDILVTVEETTTGNRRVGLSVSTHSGLCGNIAIEERNFDVLRIPTSLDDLKSCKAFRGGGQKMHLMLSLPLFGGKPSISMTLQDRPIRMKFGWPMSTVEFVGAGTLWLGCFETPN